MHNSQIEISTQEFEATEIEEEAEYVKIIKILFQGGDVTTGKIYKVERMYYNDNPSDFLNGEAYVINDVGKPFFGAFNMCRTEMYTLKKK
ncbi:hypothetical protein [Paenibacillus sp. FSL E2-0178]|uniref:hypothetical protein n=1 Tax=Paenibacillus sp. FSL E2-0178 TaxID=2921361 RepID=UPI00315804DD